MAITVRQISHNQEAKPNPQGTALAFPAAVANGNTLVTIVVGKQNPNPYPAGVSTSLAGAMKDNSPAPKVTNGAGVATGWVSQVALKNIDAKVVAGTLFTDESKMDFNGDYPSVYIFTKGAVAAAETIKVNDCYAGPSTPGVQDANGAAGVPIFVHGHNLIGLEVAGLSSGLVASSNIGAVTAANPALSGAAFGAAGNLAIAVGYQKNGNVFAPSSGWTLAYSDKCFDSQDHFVVAYKILTGADRGSFANPLGYEMAVASIILA